MICSFHMLVFKKKAINTMDKKQYLPLTTEMMWIFPGILVTLEIFCRFWLSKLLHHLLKKLVSWSLSEKKETKKKQIKRKNKNRPFLISNGSLFSALYRGYMQSRMSIKWVVDHFFLLSVFLFFILAEINGFICRPFVYVQNLRQHNGNWKSSCFFLCPCYYSIECFTTFILHSYIHALHLTWNKPFTSAGGKFQLKAKKWRI